MTCVVTRDESTLGDQWQEKVMIHEGRQRLIPILDCRGHWINPGVPGRIIFACHEGNVDCAPCIGTDVAVSTIGRNQTKRTDAIIGGQHKLYIVVTRQQVGKVIATVGIRDVKRNQFTASSWV